jgi:hypothetical protein
MIKRRDERHRVVGVEMKAVYGDEAELIGQMGQSTAYVERTHPTHRRWVERRGT